MEKKKKRANAGATSTSFYFCANNALNFFGNEHKDTGG
jgi:hypothetical protein